jgi:hypothetical protein
MSKRCCFRIKAPGNFGSLMADSATPGIRQLWASERITGYREFETSETNI